MLIIIINVLLYMLNEMLNGVLYMLNDMLNGILYMLNDMRNAVLYMLNPPTCRRVTGVSLSSGKVRSVEVK